MTRIGWRAVVTAIVGLGWIACAPTEEAPQQAAPQSDVVTLRVSVSDETTVRPVSGRPELWVRGAGSWFPNLEFGGDVCDYQGLVVGSSQEFVFDPTGMDDPEIAFDVPITDGLCPVGCARDTLLISIWDDRFEVLAPGGETITVPRP